MVYSNIFINSHAEYLKDLFVLKGSIISGLTDISIAVFVKKLRLPGSEGRGFSHFCMVSSFSRANIIILNVKWLSQKLVKSQDLMHLSYK